MRYIRPKSLTWWAGLAAVALGVSGAILAPAADPQATQAVNAFSRVLAGLIGSADASPAGLILGGLGLIGLRDKLERD